MVYTCALVISVKSNLNSLIPLKTGKKEIRKWTKHERPIFPKQSGLLQVGGVEHRAKGMVEIPAVLVG